MVPDGLLFFPVTPFAAEGGVDSTTLAEHVRERVDGGAACVFGACGTGEFHALGVEDHLVATRACVAGAAGRVPVFVGVGGSVGMARDLVRNAQVEGASGILLMPPNFDSAPEPGALRYVREIAEFSDLPVIVYQRGSMRFSGDGVLALTEIPSVVGLKDGVGDISQMQCLVSTIRNNGNDDFLFFNGLPTAELSMVAYRSIGITRYSSAVFSFAPDIAMEYFIALETDNTRRVQLLLNEFFIPFSVIRGRVPGYQVSLVKAAVEVGGRAIGGVRPPLVDPSEADLIELEALLLRVRTSLGTQSGV